MAIGPYLTTAEAADRLNVHPSRISHFVAESRLNVAQRYGTAMLFLRSEIERFARLDRPRGRPPEKKLRRLQNSR